MLKNASRYELLAPSTCWIIINTFQALVNCCYMGHVFFLNETKESCIGVIKFSFQMSLLTDQWDRLLLKL